MRTFAHSGIAPIHAYRAPAAHPLPMATGLIIALGVSLLLWAMIIAIILAI